MIEIEYNIGWGCHFKRILSKDPNKPKSAKSFNLKNLRSKKPTPKTHKSFKGRLSNFYFNDRILSKYKFNQT